MTFQIISGKTLSEYIKEGDSLLIDLRSRMRYEQEHIPHAVWADWEHAETDIPFLWEEYIRQRGTAPRQIILYCDSGHTSLITARDISAMGYPVMSLNGGYDRWQRTASL